MTDPASAAPTQTVVVAPVAQRGFLRDWLPVCISIVTTAVLLAGFLLTIGGWRATVDKTLEDLTRRMGKAESNQERYIPVLIGMNKDLSYLAERARREDERRDRLGR